jgi:hydrogenase expression/formation protein HypC
MCLAIPGRIVDSENIGGSRVGNVEFGGIARKVYLDFVPEAVPGDYVIVHAGFAISLVDAEEAERTFALLEEMGALAEEGIDAS